MSFGSRSGGGAGGGGGPDTNVNIESVGGVPIAGATVKGDGMTNAGALQEVGARAQFFNGVTWDRGRSGFVGVVATFVGYQNSLPYAVFHTVPTVRANGEGGPLEADANGALKVNVVAGGSTPSASVGLVGAAAPGSADQAGFVNAGGLLEPARVYDTDTGAGTENTLGTNLRISAGGGSIEAKGQQLMASSIPVVIASDQSAIPVTGVIAGGKTPSDAYANPVDAFDSWSLNGVWDPTLAAGAGAWSRLYGSTTLGARVNETQAPQYEDDANGVAATINKPLAVGTYAPTKGINLGIDSDVSWKATPGNVFSVYCVNKNTTKRYLQLFNKASAPAAGDVPVWEFPLAPAGSAGVNDSMTLIGSDFFTTQGDFFSVGIATGYSTTSGSYTAGTAADQVVGIMYK